MPTSHTSNTPFSLVCDLEDVVMRGVLAFWSMATLLASHTHTGPDHHTGNANFSAGPCCENHYNGIMLRLAEQIKAMFLRDPGRASVYYLADGKPLLFWWMGA